ncbi:MAG: SDR family NAD(P)-dependent oxidoreductase [Pseudomonadota bacterium]
MVDEDVDGPELSATLAVNTVAPAALIGALGPGMAARGWGRIVNVSSGWGSFDEGLGGPAAYAISKAALNAVTVRGARALGPAVKVNAACPGWVRTRMGGAGADRAPEEGAETPLWLATLPDDGPTGGFFRDRSPIAW